MDLCNCPRIDDQWLTVLLLAGEYRLLLQMIWIAAASWSPCSVFSQITAAMTTYPCDVIDKYEGQLNLFFGHHPLLRHSLYCTNLPLFYDQLFIIYFIIWNKMFDNFNVFFKFIFQSKGSCFCEFIIQWISFGKDFADFSVFFRERYN